MDREADRLLSESQLAPLCQNLPSSDELDTASIPNRLIQRVGEFKRYVSKNICFVTETYPPEVNGVALTLRQLVSSLIERGHTVSVVRPHQSSRYSNDIATTTIEVRGVPLPGYRAVQVGLPASSLLKRFWAQSRPDVAYVATEGPLGWSAVKTAQRLRIPTLSGFHTNFDGYARHYRLGWLQPLVFRYLRRFHNLTAATLTATPDLRVALQKHGFKNLLVVGRGVDSSLFSPDRRSEQLRREWSLGPQDLAAIYVGRLAPEKNIELSIAAFRQMRQLSAGLRFVAVGDGPSRTMLERKHPDLIFSGRQTGSALAQHFASADMFLFASDTETFGNVTLEAMASGLAVVAYNYAAAKRHIVHGETGMLAPFKDEAAFVAASTTLVRDRKLLRSIQLNARRYITKVGWQRVVDDFKAALTLAQTRTRQMSGGVSVHHKFAVT